MKTVTENMKLFSKKQVAGAEKARALQDIVWFLSDQDYTNAIRNNNINNCPISTDDVRIATKIWGPNIGSIKAKTVRVQPKKVIQDRIESVPSIILKEHQCVTLFADTFFINRIPFFITLSDHLQFMTIESLKNRKAATFQAALENAFGVHDNRQQRFRHNRCTNGFRISAFEKLA